MMQAGLRGSVGRWGRTPRVCRWPGRRTQVLAELDDLLERLPAGGLVTAWVTLVGHSLASDELLAGAADLARRARRPDDDAHLAVGHRRPGLPGSAPVLARSCTWTSLGSWARTCCSPTPCTWTTRSWSCCWPAAPLSRTAPGRTCGSARASVRPVGMARSSSEAGGWRWAATRSTPATRSTSCVPPRWRAASPRTSARTRPGWAPAAGVRARHDRRRRGRSAWPTPIGSLEPGKAADIVVHRTSAPGLDPARRHRAPAGLVLRRPRRPRRARRRPGRRTRPGLPDRGRGRTPARRPSGSRASLLGRAGHHDPTTWPPSRPAGVAPRPSAGEPPRSGSAAAQGAVGQRRRHVARRRRGLTSVPGATSCVDGVEHVVARARRRPPRAGCRAAPSCAAR